MLLKNHQDKYLEFPKGILSTNGFKIHSSLKMKSWNSPFFHQFYFSNSYFTQTKFLWYKCDFKLRIDTYSRLNKIPQQYILKNEYKLKILNYYLKLWIGIRNRQLQCLLYDMFPYMLFQLSKNQFCKKYLLTVIKMKV